MKNNITEIVFILDRSGSMSGLESDTIGGFNSMLKKQKSEEGSAFVSTIMFNERSQVVHDRLPLDKVAPLTEKDYVTCGSTALLDAVGGAIHHIGTIHRYAREEDIPEHTIFIITTDGMENSSHLYSTEEVKKLIERQKEKHGWEFLFLGANIDAVKTAKNIGISEDRATDYCCDEAGTELNYQAISGVLSNVRSSKPLSAAWKQSITEDYNRRKR